MSPDEARRLYIQFIENAKINPPKYIRKGSIERHHIVPKCKSCGGSKTNPNNIVKLSPRQHFEAHMLLCEVYPEKSIQRRDMKLAMYRLTHGNKNIVEIVTAEEYERIKILRAEAMSELMTGRKQRREIVETRAALHRGKKRTLETCENIRNAMKGKKQSPVHRQHTSEAARRPDTKIKRMNIKGRIVYKRDPGDGHIIEKYNNIVAAGRSVDVKREQIISCCKHLQRFICGYIWSYANEVFDFQLHLQRTEERKKKEKRLPLSKEERKQRNRITQLNPIVNEKRTNSLKTFYTPEYKAFLQTISPHSKVVNCYTKELQFVMQYMSILDAQRKLNISCVGRACRNKQPFAGGFIWRYASDCDPITHMPS